MKKKLSVLLAGTMLLTTILMGCGGGSDTSGTSSGDPGELEGEITFWHSFTQGARLDTIQAAADEFAEAAKALTKDGVYGCSFPSGSGDFMATRFLNFYARSAGESLLTDDLQANLTSDAVIDGIHFWVDIYENCSPKDSVNYVTSLHVAPQHHEERDEVL